MNILKILRVFEDIYVSKVQFQACNCYFQLIALRRVGTEFEDNSVTLDVKSLFWLRCAN
jgi:hypothetical protein